MRQSLFILAAVVLGLGLGRIEGVAERAGGVILPSLIVMLTIVFLGLRLRQVAEAAVGHRRAIGLSLAINFIWNPLLAWLLGWIFLSQQPALWLGLILLMVTPCTDWYLVFTHIARGNAGLAAALLPWNLALQLILLPVFVLLLAGTLVPLDGRLLLQSVALVLLLPLLAAAALRRWAVARMGLAWLDDVLVPRSQPAQLIFLGLAVMAMFASEASAVLAHPDTFLALLWPVLLFFAVNFGLAWLAGRATRLSYPDYAALCCTTLARNSPVALAIALAAFPGQPLIALALVIGPLIELPVLSLAAQLLLRIRATWAA
jgi:arsenite transporter